MVFIRTDANEQIATGHMVRCMTVAKELAAQGQQVEFLVSDRLSALLLEENCLDYIVLDSKWDQMDNPYELKTMKSLLVESCGKEQKVPLLLVDSYFVQNHYFEELRPYAKLAFFDDLCRETYDVDLLINYNITHTMYDYTDKYRNKDTCLLLGPRYAPLRKQFAEYAQRQTAANKKSAGHFAQVLLICGGTDPFHILSGILKKAKSCSHFDNYFFHVVAGAYHSDIKELALLEKEIPNCRLYHNVKEMAALMAVCDIAVTAAGTILYECCAMGLPTVFFVMAENQEKDALAFAKDDAMLYAGDIRKEREQTVRRILEYLRILAGDGHRRLQMSSHMKNIVDGEGAKRIASLFQRTFEIGSFYEEDFDRGGVKKNNLWEWLVNSTDRSISFWVDGRAAIEAAVCDIENRISADRKVCILPQYTCDTVVLPFQEHGWEIYYYALRSDLSVDKDDFVRLLDRAEPAVLFMHTYFGADTIAQVRYLIRHYKKQKGMIYMEDMTQSLFLTGKAAVMADYVVGSIRKWAAVPDGGFCISPEKIDISQYGVYDRYLQVKRDAQRRKKEYLDGGLESKETYLELNRRSEAMLYETPRLYRMSDQSALALKKIDADDIWRKRNKNMLVLDQAVRSMMTVRPLIDFKEDAAPLYYPIAVNDRDKVQKRLRGHGIYAPVLWEIPKMIPDITRTVNEIYNRMLAIPCDQRYDARDMEYIANVMKHEIEHE